MDEFVHKKDRLRKAFPKHQSSSVNGTFESQHYAIASEDEFVKRFRLIKRSGEIYSVPYSLLPIFILLESKELVIKTYGVHIIIKGRNLNPLEDYLSEEALVWIKESPSGKDDGKTNVFVSEIFIRGKAINHTEDVQNEEI